MARYDFGIVSPTRRKTMQAIKRKNTNIEIAVRRELYKRGYRYRVDYAKLPGRPDIVFTGQRVVVFCDSEFWHGKEWAQRKEKMLTNKSYWIPKIEGNIKRDKKVTRELRKQGWSVLRFWETEICKDLMGVVSAIEQELKK
jgi:DNA mismatch endonuclease, patch repair protein